MIKIKESKKEEKAIYDEIMNLNNELIDIQRRLQKKNKELEETNERLRKALDEIKYLKRLLPICVNCKKIRTDEGYWQEIDSYFKEHGDLKFSHGFCNDCFRKLYPKEAETILNDKEKK